jgi:hypothetical protein
MSNVVPSKFFVYGLFDPRTNEVRYVGKTCCGMKRPKGHVTPSVLKRDVAIKGNWIRGLLQ